MFDTMPQPVFSTLISQSIGGNTMSRFSELKDFVESLEEDFTKFYQKGNKAAGTRVRKGMQELKRKAQDIRVEVQEQKNEM